MRYKVTRYFCNALLPTLLMSYSKAPVAHQCTDLD